MARSSSDSGGRINISASTKKLDVDNRISLLFYFRIADNILKQAEIFREEKNVIDLYVMLLRFSSLVSETIPCHRDYRRSLQSNKLKLKKKLIAALTELEELKPDVQAKLEELQNKHGHHSNKQSNFWQKETQTSSVEYPAFKQQNWNSCLAEKPVTREFGYQGTKTLSLAKPVEEHLRRISLSIPRPKEETLSRHSILGPNGLRGQWQPPSNHKVVQYPSNLDFSPLHIPRDNSIQQSIKDESVMRKDDDSSDQERSSLESLVQSKNDTQQIQESDSLISFETVESFPQTEIIRQPSPPPFLVDVQDLIPTSPPATDMECGLENASDDALVCSDPLELHIPTDLMDSFMKLAKSNTNKNLETCGILAGSLKNRKFHITALIIPKQESTSDSCQATNEEEIFEVQDKRSLFPLGWIHIMLPEAIAIVMAPRDSSKNHGIFRLTPGGMTVIRACPKRGFHSHDPPDDGSPIYRHCTDVYMNSTLKFDVIDLR
ncbi:hypothetical protein RD792_014810 [Penstemon davidsonii]|uniref:AMSH-like ubiquitin thioesterase 1 n=1 Tax=Penstemon davidsonii TaxID=160366 RepID=A0ABR0CQB6_9LAMI|nr:hypothetical protein RD792_014810 [Penstemon davidsonii]